jgi:site-specific recombinase XerD
MAKVFTGKVLIPGDKMEEYLQALQESGEEREPFQKFLTELNREFSEYLAQQFSARTARGHSHKIGLFIDFLCWNTDVRSIEEITKGIANSHFKRWYMSKIGDCSESELKASLKKFFQFLAQQRGIRNEEVLKSFKK